MKLGDIVQFKQAAKVQEIRRSAIVRHEQAKVNRLEEHRDKVFAEWCNRTIEAKAQTWDLGLLQGKRAEEAHPIPEVAVEVGPFYGSRGPTGAVLTSFVIVHRRMRRGR